MLNDECMLKKSSVENFSNNLTNAWKTQKSGPISWNFRAQKENNNIFIIRHFTNDVIYSTVCQSFLFKYLF